MLISQFHLHLLDNLEIWRAPAHWSAVQGGRAAGYTSLLFGVCFHCIPFYIGIGSFGEYNRGWRGCPGESKSMAAWLTFLIAIFTTVLTQVNIPGPVESQQDSVPLNCFSSALLLVSQCLQCNVVTRVIFPFRYLDLVFSNSTFTNSEISKACSQMAMHASLNAGLSSEFA